MSNNHPPKRTRQIIRSFEAKALRRRSFSQRIADFLTSSIGTIIFLIANIMFFTTWILINMGVVPGIPQFDPYPFVLLITTVSLEAILLAVIVLISQNRESQIATIRDELQLQVELITEKEMSKVLSLLKKVLENQGEKVKDPELEEMLQSIDTSYIEKKLQDQISGKSSFPTKSAKS